MLKKSGIPLTIGIRNPNSTNKESTIQYLESGICSVESRIQDCLGFPYGGLSGSKFSFLVLLFGYDILSFCFNILSICYWGLMCSYAMLLCYCAILLFCYDVLSFCFNILSFCYAIPSFSYSSHSLLFLPKVQLCGSVVLLGYFVSIF